MESLYLAQVSERKRKQPDRLVAGVLSDQGKGVFRKGAQVGSDWLAADKRGEGRLSRFQLLIADAEKRLHVPQSPESG